MNIHTAVPGKSERIRALNDALRTTFVGGQIVVTAAFTELSAELKAKALQRVRTFSEFNSDNDPYNEHDMAFFAVDDTSLFFKLDYYAEDMMHGSDDPSDPEKTRRVLTIGLSSD